MRIPINIIKTFIPPSKKVGQIALQMSVSTSLYGGLPEIVQPITGEHLNSEHGTQMHINTLTSEWYKVDVILHFVATEGEGDA